MEPTRVGCCLESNFLEVFFMVYNILWDVILGQLAPRNPGLNDGIPWGFADGAPLGAAYLWNPKLN